MKRPVNHVTQAIDAFRSTDNLSALPVVDLKAIERLEAVYPPVCLGRAETVEDHLRYAGKVELVALLRQRAMEADPDGLTGAERAS